MNADLGAPEVVSRESQLSLRYERPGELPSSAVGLIVDAYERLGGRLLNRLRDLREDMDGDLASLRSELATMRTSVEDVADRVQLRTMRSSLDELRGDVAALRRSMTDQPESGDTTAALGNLRADLEDLHATVRKRPPLAELAPLVEELAALRGEMAALRRRIRLRASAEGSSLGPDELDAIADVVTQRLLEVIKPQ